MSRRGFLLASAATGAELVWNQGSTRAAAASGGVASAGAGGVAPYLDPGLGVAARVADLLGRMTLAEKLAQLECVADQVARIEDGHGGFEAARAVEAFPDGIGHFASPGMYVGRPPGGPQRGPGEMAAYTNAVQRWAVEQTRLRIPILFHEEALHGHRGQGSTSFPQAIALASSWDPELVERVFAVAARETRARGGRMVLAPVVDVVRDPRWGRVDETYGEDPHLVTEIGLAAVRGFQGATLPLGAGKVLATLKHFVADGEPANGTNTGPTMAGPRTLREVFFPPFRTILQTLPVRSVMVTYNEIDGVPCAANRWLLDDVLRGEWGFVGMVVADYQAIIELHEKHEIAATPADAAARALDAGVDVEMPDPPCFPLLKDLLLAGRVKIGRIDEAVSRVLAAKFEADLFEHPYVDAEAAAQVVNTADARSLACEAAERSMVLLSNDGVLPLKAGVGKQLAVLGHHAADTPLGGYSGVPPQVVSVLEGLRSNPNGWNILYAEGVRLTQNHDWYQDKVEAIPDAVNDSLIAQAVEVARGADTVVLVLGDNEQTAREAWSDSHLGDRQSLDLWGRQNELAEKVLALGKPTILVLLNGRPLTIDRLAGRVNAIIEGWYLGQETGTAVAKVLHGQVNPGGKLPISIPRSVGQLPVYYNAKPTARRGYLDGSTQPLFAFGHGLSYTRFDLSPPTLVRHRIRLSESAAVRVTVQNTGSRAGDEVVQVYLHHAFPSVTQPVLSLKAFRRVSLQPGEARELEFTLAAESFSIWDERMRLVVEPGDYEIHAGAGLDSLKSVTLTISA